MDFHGSYKHAVTALNNAVDLHGASFPSILQNNQEWMGRKIEGPNIANVFKRTFYQILIKFRLAGHGDCRGVVLGLPSAVWESWSPHLNSPVLEPHEGDYVLKGTSVEHLNNSWIYVFGTDNNTLESKEPLFAQSRIKIDVDALLTKAFEDVPNHITKNLVGNIRASIIARLQKAYNQVEIDAQPSLAGDG